MSDTNRRWLVIKTVAVTLSIVVLLVAGGVWLIGSTDAPQENTTQTTTETVETPSTADKAIAIELLERLREKNVNASVSLTADGDYIVVDIRSVGEEDPNDVVDTIAIEYAEVLRENQDVGRLTITLGEHRVLVPKDTAQAYVDGKIKKSAYLKTLEYRSSSQDR